MKKVDKRIWIIIFLLILGILDLFFRGGGFLLLLAIAALFIYLYSRFLYWVAKVARRNNRSATGFVWLAVFFPFLVVIILLIIDKKPEPKSN
jgi:energy-coupling factor transporter transmembrane protein EcfT